MNVSLASIMEHRGKNSKLCGINGAISET